MTFMRIARGRWTDPSTGTSQAVLDAAQELYPAVTALPGNLNYFGGVDPSGAAVAVTLWDTEEHAKALVDKVTAIAAKLQALGLQMESDQTFEVRTPT
jgi:hypothetical protein